MKKQQGSKKPTQSQIIMIIKNLDQRIEEWVGYFIDQIDKENHKRTEQNGY